MFGSQFQTRGITPHVRLIAQFCATKSNQSLIAFINSSIVFDESSNYLESMSIFCVTYRAIVGLAIAVILYVKQGNTCYGNAIKRNNIIINLQLNHIFHLCFKIIDNASIIVNLYCQ